MLLLSRVMKRPSQRLQVEGSGEVAEVQGQSQRSIGEQVSLGMHAWDLGGGGGLGIYSWASNRRELHMFSCFLKSFLLCRNTYSMHMAPLRLPPNPLLKKNS